jgi:diphosphomevalonate decarboxylase
MLEVTRWRKSGTAVCYTIDAGPNVHVLCDSEHASEISKQLSSLPGVLEILISHPGGATRLESINPGN